MALTATQLAAEKTRFLKMFKLGGPQADNWLSPGLLASVTCSRNSLAQRWIRLNGVVIHQRPVSASEAQTRVG